MPYHSDFLTKDETGLVVLNLPTFYYWHDLNLWSIRVLTTRGPIPATNEFGKQGSPT